MSGDVTLLLQRWSEGDPDAFEQLVPLVYAELRSLARGHLARERADHTLEPTGLVHEAYLRLVDRPSGNWTSRRQFYAVASQVIRRVLVDHARARVRKKRGGGKPPPLELATPIGWPSQRNLEIIQLDAALSELAQLDETQSRIVELRFYTGLTIEETADILEISPATVKRAWSSARAWLLSELDPPEPGAPAGLS